MAFEVAAAEVTAAWIAAAAAIIAAVANVAIALWVDRKRRAAEASLAAERTATELTLAAGQQEVESRMAAEQRDSELIVAALVYFQGSQRRSVGIAALAVLRERPAWAGYRATVSQLFYRQLLYLFSHAETGGKRTRSRISKA